MPKLLRYLLPIISLVAGISTLNFGAELVKRFSPQKPEVVPITEVINDPFIREVDLDNMNSGVEIEMEPIPTAYVPSPTLRVEETIAKTPEWMVYDDIDLYDSTIKLSFKPACEEVMITLPVFDSHAWYPGIFDSGVFNIGNNTAVVWDHLGYYGVWMHAGLDANSQPLTAYPLQNYLEIDSNSKIRNTEQFDTMIQECLLGSLVLIEEEENKSLSRITAAVRIPSENVPEVSQHVMDLVPYLANNYPESGFTELEPPAMLLYFCGRRLSNETMDPTMNYWTQSRIIIAFEPWQDDPGFSR